jgi:hypothetical protein
VWSAEAGCAAAAGAAAAVIGSPAFGLTAAAAVAGCVPPPRYPAVDCCVCGGWEASGGGDGGEHRGLVRGEVHGKGQMAFVCSWVLSWVSLSTTCILLTWVWWCRGMWVMWYGVQVNGQRLLCVNTACIGSLMAVVQRVSTAAQNRRGTRLTKLAPLNPEAALKH